MKSDNLKWFFQTFALKIRGNPFVVVDHDQKRFCLAEELNDAVRLAEKEGIKEGSLVRPRQAEPLCRIVIRQPGA